MLPDVSIVIPAYNTAAYIDRAIASALHQTLSNLEVIVVDDGSTDGTVEVVKRYSDPRLKLFVHPQNLGVSVARNRAFQLAQGKWISVLDSDDWMAPDRLEKLVQIADVKQADVIADDLYFINPGDDRPWATLVGQSKEPIHTIQVIDPVRFVETGIYGKPGLHLGLSKPLFKREFLQQYQLQYDESMQVVEDFHLAMMCLIEGGKFVLVPTPYYFYLQRPGSLVTQNKIRHIDQFSYAIREILAHDKVRSQPQLQQVLLNSLAELQKNKSYYSVVEPLKQGKFKESILNMIRHPDFFIEFSKRIGAVLSRRIRHYIFREKHVFQTLNH